MSSDDCANPSSRSDEDQTILGTNTILPGTSSAKPVLGRIPSTKKIPSSFIEFALNKVEQYVLALDHEDIDINIDLQNDPTDEEWTNFLEQFYAAIK